MAEIKKRPSWVVPAVVGGFILLFIAIGFIGGALSRPGGRSEPSSPKSPANGAPAQAFRVPLRLLTGS